MPLTDAGRDHMLQLTLGEVVDPFSNAYARLGVGDGSGAFNSAQTDLLGTNKLRRAMNATYPQRTGNTVIFQALFGLAEANFAWNEWGIFNHASAGVMLNRKVESLGTKTSAQSWQLTVTVQTVAA